jgi:hypothetical protein
MAHAEGFKAKPKKALNIVFAKAVAKPELVIDMYKQLDPSFLKNPQPLYLVKVVHKNVEYSILGSRLQFISFFKNKWKYAVKIHEAPELGR